MLTILGVIGGGVKMSKWEAKTKLYLSNEGDGKKTKKNQISIV